MPIPLSPVVPDPNSATFATDAYTFTQWMAAAAPEFDAAATLANAAATAATAQVPLAAAQVTLATTQAGSAALSATTASGFATASDTARGLSVTAKVESEAARDLSQNYAAAAGAAAGLPALVGQGGKGLKVKVNETGVEWGSGSAANITRAVKTSDYTALPSDQGSFIDCSGTWELGFDAAIAAGWWCYVRNVGAGVITADPAGSTTIDGVASGVIKPNMTLLVQRDATGFQCLRMGPGVAMEVLTGGTAGNIPLGVRTVRARVQGAGASGSNSARSGAYAESCISVSPGASYSYSVGAGVVSSVGGASTLTMGGRSISAAGGDTSTSTATGGDINIKSFYLNASDPASSLLGTGGRGGGINLPGYGAPFLGVGLAGGNGIIILEY